MTSPTPYQDLTREERRELVARLRADGMPIRDIATTVGIGVGTVHRYLTSGTPTGEAIEQNENPKPQGKKRRPLPESFREAAHDLSRVVDRIDRLASDDRLPRYAEQVATIARADLLRAVEQLTTVLDRIPASTQGR